MMLGGAEGGGATLKRSENYGYRTRFEVVSAVSTLHEVGCIL